MKKEHTINFQQRRKQSYWGKNMYSEYDSIIFLEYFESQNMSHHPQNVYNLLKYMKMTLQIYIVSMYK